jgi:hypothetical protein
MALKGVLRPGCIQIRVTDLDAALKDYVDRVGLSEVSREHAVSMGWSTSADGAPLAGSATGHMTQE